MRGDTIRVLLADDHAVVRAGAKALIAGAKDMTVVGDASTGAQAIALARSCDPDIVVLDLDMPEGDGLEVTRAIVAQGPRPRVLVMTMHDEDEHLVPILEAGATGYVVKTDADRELVDAIRAVANGKVHVRQAGARVLAKRLTKKDPARVERERYASLSDRERSVLRMTAEGYTAPEIGRKLSISPKTVDTYKQRVHEKLGLGHRADYVRFALKVGLLTAT